VQDSDSSPTRVTRSELVRAGNARVLAAAERHRFEVDAPLPVLCECDDDECREFVRATVAEVRAAQAQERAILAPDHGRSEVARRREAFHDVALPPIPKV
jgi:hypothetical protein